MADGGELELVLSESEDAMGKSIKHLRTDLKKIRTGRANPSLLDGIQVDYYGTPTALNQLANLTAPDPKLIVVSPYDKGALPAIEKAIQASDLGLTPNNDGKLVRIPIPPLTEERRKELVRVVKKMAEEGRISIRNIRRDARKELEGAEKDNQLTSDELARAEKDLDRITHSCEATVDGALATKEDELLEV